MVAINFPDSPTNGQEHSGYVWDATNNVWNRLPTLPALDLVNFSAVAPSNPQDGQFWFDTTAGKMYVYYNDGSSAQWVSTLGGLVGQTGTDGQFLIHNGTEWVASNFTSPGSILQVVSTTKTDTFTSATSAAWVDVPGLSLTITPKSTSSKILAFVSPDATGTVGYAFFGQLVRDSTPISIGDADSLRTRVSWQNTMAGGTANNHLGPFGFSYLDSPATTSSVTYKFRVQVQGGGTIYVNRNETSADNLWISRTASTITLMEVAG